MNLLEWVRQYPDWCDICEASGSIIYLGNNSEWVDRVTIEAEALSYIHLVEHCSKLACGDRWEQLLLSVVEDIPCEMLDVKPCELQSFLVFLRDKLAL